MFRFSVWSKRAWRFLRSDLPIVSIVISLLALWMSWDTRRHDELKILREEQNKAHLAFQLGKDLTKVGISIAELNHQFSWELVLQQQGIVDQLGLRLVLGSLFESGVRDHMWGEAVIYNYPFEVIYERLRDFHGEQVAAAFNVGRYAQWLSFRSRCIKTVEQEEKLRSLYDHEAGITNQELRKVARLFGRDFSKYELDKKPISMKTADAQTLGILMDMERELQERTDSIITGVILSCPDSGF